MSDSWRHMNRSMPGLLVHHELPESTQTHVHWFSDAIQPSHPLSSSSPLALIFPSIRVFSNESALHIRWPKDWSFSFSISLSDEHPGLISFRMDWLDFLADQGTLKSLLQHHSWEFPREVSEMFPGATTCFGAFETHSSALLQCKSFWSSHPLEELLTQIPLQGEIKVSGVPWRASG